MLARHIRLTVALWAVLALTGSALCAAPPEDPPAAKTTVKTVAAFKNGLGFVFRAGDAKLQDGWAAIEEIPAAALGTLWIGTTSKAGPVQEVISCKTRKKDTAAAFSIPLILQANIGRQASLVVNQGSTTELREVRGTIVSIPMPPSGTEPRPASYLGDPRFGNDAQVVIVRTSSSTIALNIRQVQSVEIIGGELASTLEADVPGAKVRIGGAPASAEITMAYLEKGINWNPGYLVNIADAKQADITLEAVLANDVEDLNDVEVSFVVGYPNFMFADLTTPLALQQTVSSFMEGLTRGSREMRDRYAGAEVARQSIAYNFAGDFGGYGGFRPESTYSATTPMAGESNEDLFFYRQPHVTLKKGDRARYSVFTAKVPYEHIYQWDVPDSMSIDDRGRRVERNTPDAQNEATMVWHALRIENTSKLPWTTAPAFTVNGPMPVAQDILRYTPPGAKGVLKLTVATDVRAEQQQTEVSRKPMQIFGYNYEEVVVDGKLTVRNWKKDAVKMSVTKTLVGDVLANGEGSKVTKVAKALSSLNPTSEISWDFELKAGEEKTLTYQYKALVSR